jgi:hypothetical protein
VTREVTELVGVYHADGGPVGELRYVVGKVLGTAHCALCDITHSGVRRKPEWTRLAAGLGVPFRLFHLNDQPDDVASVVSTFGSPAVLARLADGTVEGVLGSTSLDRLDGSVPAFVEALRSALDRVDLQLPTSG